MKKHQLKERIEDQLRTIEQQRKTIERTRHQRDTFKQDMADVCGAVSFDDSESAAVTETVAEAIRRIIRERDDAREALTEQLTAQRVEVERLSREVESRRTVCREASQTLIAEVGADGPMNLLDVVERTVQSIAEANEKATALGVENARLRADVEEWRQKYTLRRSGYSEEIDRMRPVVEAAEAWERWWATGDAVRSHARGLQLKLTLRKAVEAWRTGEPLPNNQTLRPVKACKGRILQELEALDPECVLFVGFDAAIVGTIHRCGQPTLVAYSYGACVDVLIADGLTPEEAEEHMSFNVEGGWLGDRTPCVIHPLYPASHSLKTASNK